MEARLVDFDASLSCNLLCDLKREAKRVVQHESLRARQHGLRRVDTNLSVRLFLSRYAYMHTDESVPTRAGVLHLARGRLRDAAGEQLVQKGFALFQRLNEPQFLALQLGKYFRCRRRGRQAKHRCHGICGKAGTYLRSWRRPGRSQQTAAQQPVPPWG